MFMFIFIFLAISLLLTTAVSTPTDNHTIHLPIITNPVANCNVPDQNFGTLPVIPPPTDRPAEIHADLNLALRSYEPTNDFLGLVDYDGETDPKAPQLAYLFSDLRVPTFSSVHQVHGWDWSCNCQEGVYTFPSVTLLGTAVSPNEIIHVPNSGYDIGRGYDVLVLYASQQRITLKYTGEDNVVFGYTIHIEDVCVDPALLSLYESWNANGRGELPALRGGQAFGRAMGNEIKVSVRDTGAFLDPRSQKDWWQ